VEKPALKVILCYNAVNPDIISVIFFNIIDHVLLALMGARGFGIC